MTKKLPDTIFIDFDSTLVTLESIELLAKRGLAKQKDREDRMARLEELTKRAMNGDISFRQSLQVRLALFEASKRDVAWCAQQLKKHITKSFLDNLAFFKREKKRIYVISGGFREAILPTTRVLGIADAHVFANDLVYDKKGSIIGIDTENILSENDGKMQIIKQLAPHGSVVMLGDGANDARAKEVGERVSFYCFTENVKRTGAVARADQEIKNFDEFLYQYGLLTRTSYPKSKMKVLLLENIHPDAIARLEREGFTVETETKALDAATLMKRIKDVSLLGIRSKTTVTEEVFAHAPKLLAVGAFCIGTDQIDLVAAAKRGVATFNAPYSNTRSVVELVIGQIIVLFRKITEVNAVLHRGQWIKSATGCNEVRGKTLGIIGYGNIGSQLSVLAESLGMSVIFYDLVEKLALGNARRAITMEELLRVSDVVSVHVDGRAANGELISEKQLSWMKKGSYLINSSRGKVLDIGAVARAVQSQQLGGVAVDVFPEEPASNAEPFVSELQQLPNVVLTSHIGGSTQEAQAGIGKFVSDRLIEFVNVGSTDGSVSLPQVKLAQPEKAHRFLHMHHNQPGVLASINNLFASKGVNILGQYLKTNDHVGYVITDIERDLLAMSPVSHSLKRDLEAIHDTIRVRVLY